MIDHPHAGEQARVIAEAGTVLLTQVGSGVHGTSISGQDDRDEMGLCTEPARFITGLARVQAPDGQWVRFEQYEMHTAWARAGGVAERSGAGDLDVVIYSARKWARLAAAGNPTVLLPLFVPDAEVVSCGDAGRALRAEAHRFVSKHAADRFLGYLSAQRAAMHHDGAARPGRTTRPAHLGTGGYDVKYAMHALRLGIQGVELLSTGRITLPIPEPARSELRAVRSDQRTLTEVLTALSEVEEQLTRLSQANDLPPEPDRAWIDTWLHETYTAFWDEHPQR